MTRATNVGALSSRNVVLKTRVNDAEYKFISGKAALRRMPIGAYLRMAAMQRREHQSSALVREVQTLNALLLDHAIQHGQVLNFSRVAETLAELMQRAESGELS
ncbi:hypothetical protein [Pseudomonas sp.]|uniref:hypothetical protein n=1 Tax=Pseudomonas sp. TaxID=306 RepID=UPI0039819722